MHWVWENLKKDLRDPIVLVSVGVLSGLLVVSGPFGSYVSMTLAQRFSFWVPAALIGSVVGLVIECFVARWPGMADERRASIVAALLSTLILTVPMQFLMMRFIAASRSDLSGLVDIALLIFFSNLGICSLRRAWKEPPRIEPIPSAVPEPQQLPPFVSRLAADLQAPVALITGRNHHIDIETDLGSTSLFMRFSDAVLQMQPVEGMQVHRSHWVAFRRMRRVERIGQRHFLVTDAEMRIPISKSHIDALRLRIDLPGLEDISNTVSQAAE